MKEPELKTEWSSNANGEQAGSWWLKLLSRKTLEALAEQRERETRQIGRVRVVREDT